mmetsp:Transcript_30724/g.70808  ORF Transcript_30724/g.70808 Transcript_30724/m.70808 type:complete len:392 (-) Transcript_30724:60-1235(-)
MERNKAKCRVAIVGAQRQRVARVLSLVHTINETTDEEILATIEYLPCVAAFDSWKNDKGEMVRYLASVEYLGQDGKQKGSSLARFFDEIPSDDEQQDKTPQFPGISAFVLGCGIEEEEDVKQVETFVNALGAAEADKRPRVVVECISPNPQYQTMHEETQAYRAFSADDKAEAVRLGTIGPGKMARFAWEVADRVIRSAHASVNGTERTEIVAEPTPADQDETQDDTSETNGELVSAEPEGESDTPIREIDPNETRYACRMCRQILFREDDLEDPPHVPAKHTFRQRKAGGARGQILCESLFLARALDWMGDMSAVEGKFGCPHCGSKLGNWKWAGTQCSCGTWVTPALQVPSSKVDVLAPFQGQNPPPGVVISPFVRSPPTIASPYPKDQ